MLAPRCDPRIDSDVVSVRTGVVDVSRLYRDIQGKVSGDSQTSKGLFGAVGIGYLSRKWGHRESGDRVAKESNREGVVGVKVRPEVGMCIFYGNCVSFMLIE